MIYAPVLIPTLCRYDKFVKCFESLNDNTWAEHTELFIALDHPKRPSHREGYEKIKAYCEEVISSGSARFKSVTLLLRPRNLGAIGNFEALVHQTFQKYDRCICTFDDIEHAKNFIQYMDEMLETFQNDKNTVMVTGYSYPVKWEVEENCNAVRQNLEGNIWGVGFWKDDWEELVAYLRAGKLISAFSSAFRTGKFESMTDWAVKDYVNTVCNGTAIHSLLKQVTDVALRIYLSVEDKYAVMPTLSKTRNIGFDGSGAFCEEIRFREEEEETSSNYRFDLQPIDPERTFTPRIDETFDCGRNRAIIDRFDKRPDGERETMLAKAEAYSALRRFDRMLLNFKANTSKAKEIVGRVLRR